MDTKSGAGLENGRLISPWLIGLLLAGFLFAGLAGDAGPARAEPPASKSVGGVLDSSRGSALRADLADLRADVDGIAWPLRDADLWRALRDAEEVAKRLDDIELDRRRRADFALHLARSFGRISRAETGGEEAGESEPAAVARLRAVEIFLSVARIQSEGMDAGQRQSYWAEGELAQLYLEGERPEEALHLARRAFRAALEQEDSLARYRFGTVLARALDSTGDRAGALTALRDASKLGEMLRRDRLNRLSDARSTGVAPSPLLNDFEGQVGATQRLLALLLEELAEDGARLTGEAQQVHLREIRDLVETQRSAEIENYFGDVCLTESLESDLETGDPDEKAAQGETSGLAEAGPGALVLYPILLDERVTLLTSHNGLLRHIDAPVTSRALLDHARNLRRLLEKRTTRQYLRPAQHLYDALIHPLRDQLRDEKIEVLVVVPDGLLRTIPFAALYHAGPRRFLIDEVAVALVPSMRLTEPAPLNRDNLSVLAAGLESETAGFARLNHTREEVTQVAARFPQSRLLFDGDFATERIAEEIRNRPYSVVHLATHGRVESDGKESFLVTRDGRIGLDRMAELISTTRFRRERPLELLTLSACETASGDVDAALGLAGVAVRAGAKSALATLWPVNDEATSRMIDLFYAELLRPGQSRAGALRNAQRSVRKNPRYEHPGYWAPFLMISNWR